MGYIWALTSVLLVSSAQLAMKWAMMQFPPIELSISFLWHTGIHNLYAVLMLFSGLLAYALSMGCWFLALRRIPLSKAYPLLSLSYVLVWCAAITLPWINESYSVEKLAGVLIIFIGLLCIFWPQRSVEKI